MIEVADVAAARRALARRMLRCPDCAALLKPWGRAIPRTVSDLDGEPVTMRPDRVRCTARHRTHVLLYGDLLPRRAYTVRFLGQALASAVRGHGHRQIAAELGARRAPCAAGCAEAAPTAERLLWIGVQAVVALDPDALLTTGRGDPLAHAIEALGAAAVTVHRRFGHGPREIWPRIALLPVAACSRPP
ncbi:hypothetical protein [Streptomyces sp. TS71-3]|uniref:hypothetical protein n=1 Tax=Streptomyces sp. TS71-3 TaxID=2733862 RepID=UPI001B18CD5E|nr:hypothetical protein [Streptomyces sp. TS71-3]GHJ35455.1 hypothetical protein Sm713_10640 [Streptomyces sp. TS71-3]